MNRWMHEMDKADMEEVARAAGYHRVGWPAALLGVVAIICATVLIVASLYRHHTVDVTTCGTDVEVRP